MWYKVLCVPDINQVTACADAFVPDPDICDFAELEAAQQFRTLAQKFRVIDQKTVLAVPDDSMASAIAEGRASWQELQRHAVSVRKEKIVLWHLREIADGIYQWTLGYDSFLGYMHGVLLTE